MHRYYSDDSGLRGVPTWFLGFVSCVHSLEAIGVLRRAYVYQVGVQMAVRTVSKVHLCCFAM